MTDEPLDPSHVHAAFLSGINLGSRRLKMDELRTQVEAFGLEGVRTFIASGNVVFTHGDPDARDLEAGLEDHLARVLGFETDVLIRSFRALEALESDDEVRSALQDGFNAHAVFVREPLTADGMRRLGALEGPDDRFAAVQGDVVWLRRGGLTDAPFPMRELDAAFDGVPRTMRNLNTVRRMLGKFGPG